jgi:hypothetical protein
VFAHVHLAGEVKQRFVVYDSKERAGRVPESGF